MMTWDKSIYLQVRCLILSIMSKAFNLVSAMSFFNLLSDNQASKPKAIVKNQSKEITDLKEEINQLKERIK